MPAGMAISLPMWLCHQLGAWYSSTQQKHAFIHRLHVMPNSTIKNKDTALWEIERLYSGVHSDMPSNRVNGNASRIMVLLDAAVGFHGKHGDVEIGIPDNGLAADSFFAPI